MSEPIRAHNSPLDQDAHEHEIGPPYVPGGTQLTARLMRPLRHSHVGGRSQHTHFFGWTPGPVQGPTLPIAVNEVKS